MGCWILFAVLSIAAVSCQNDLPDQTELKAALATNAFGLDLLKILSADGKNAFFSPLSISVAFAMTSLGAKGNTLKEIEQALHFNEANQSSIFHQDFQNIITAFSKHHSDYNLTLATRLYAYDQVEFYEDFLQAVASYYKATIQQVDFSTGQVEGIINQWVEEQTQGCIKELFKPGSLDPNCVLVLVNAIYFKGNWKIKFNPEKTLDTDFHRTESDTITVKMMKVVEYFPYVDDETLNVQVLEMPYSGSNLSMIIILPPQGAISDVISQLTAQKLKVLLDKLQETKVKVKIPKFKLELGYSLEETLKQLGVKDLFETADLSGMSNISLAVTKVLHKSFVEVSEEGTEAAAVTGIEFSARSGGHARQRYPEFIANRPFLFFIVCKHDIHRIVFAGSIDQPLFTN